MNAKIKPPQSKDIFLSYLFRNLKWFSLLVVGKFSELMHRKEYFYGLYTVNQVPEPRGV